MCRARHGGPSRALSRIKDKNLVCAFVANALGFAVPKIGGEGPPLAPVGPPLNVQYIQ